MDEKSNNCGHPGLAGRLFSIFTFNQLVQPIYRGPKIDFQASFQISKETHKEFSLAWSQQVIHNLENNRIILTQTSSTFTTRI